MGNPLFVRTSVGVINLALVTQMETIGERMIFVFLGPPAEKRNRTMCRFASERR